MLIKEKGKTEEDKDWAFLQMEMKDLIGFAFIFAIAVVALMLIY